VFLGRQTMCGVFAVQVVVAKGFEFLENALSQCYSTAVFAILIALDLRPKLKVIEILLYESDLFLLAGDQV